LLLDESHLCSTFPKRKANEATSYWNTDATMYLLASLKSLNYFGNKDGRTKKKLHVEISTLLNEAGFKFTADQCCGRIKTLVDAYRKVKDHNRQSGNETKTCKFYDDLDDLLGQRPVANSVAPCSSRNPEHDYSKQADLCETHDRYNLSDSDSTDESSMPKKLKSQNEAHTANVNLKIPCKRGKKAKIVDFLHEYNKSEAEREAARLRESRRQHDETKELIQNLIYALTKKSDNN
jgi:hypothetical protein